MTKNIYASRGKSAARAEIRSFVQGIVRDPSSFTVSYFPGGIPDLEGLEIYDPLNIPRQNRVWIERRMEVTNKLLEYTAQNPDQEKLYIGEAEDFFSITPRKFDVVGIDTTEVFNDYNFSLVNSVFRNEVLNQSSVFYTVFQSKRERESSKFLYNISRALRSSVHNYGHPVNSLTEYWDVPSLPSGIEEQGVDLRDLETTENIIDAAKRGRGIGDDLRDIPSVAKRLKDAKTRFKKNRIGQECMRIVGEQFSDMIIEINEENRINYQIAKKIGNDDLAYAVIMNDRIPYFPMEMKRLSYINESKGRTSFNVDIFKFFKIGKQDVPSRADIMSGRVDPKDIKLTQKVAGLIDLMQSVDEMTKQIPERRKIA